MILFLFFFFTSEVLTLFWGNTDMVSLVHHRLLDCFIEEILNY